MAPRNLATEPAASDQLVGDKTDQVFELGEPPDDAETEEMDSPIEWRDPWADR